MWIKWFPWRSIVRLSAREYGFLDPFAVLARLRRFAQPSEVLAPTELLRSAAVLHARGLMNAQAIQHNLDWIWPYWVVRQFDPTDESFIPRAFSLTHINLTHRNWTAVGLPDVDALPLVDPRGLVTPFLDGWSLDGWVMTDGHRALIPSHGSSVTQRVELDATLAVVTQANVGALTLTSRVDLILQDGRPVCRISLTGVAEAKGWLIVALRPYNPEGVSFIYDIALRADRRGWRVNGKQDIEWNAPADRAGHSRYRLGDVYRRLPNVNDAGAIKSHVGMATAAALFQLSPHQPREILVRVPLSKPPAQGLLARRSRPTPTWEQSLARQAQLRMSYAGYQSLYDVALRMLVLHTPGEVYPGPYTYKRFWFRDAAFILHALLNVGLIDRVERALDKFPVRQTPMGHFLSQDGEWDSNGQALWILWRFCELGGRPPKPSWRQPIRRAVRWIATKRLAEGLKETHAGLLPAGFSAEHFGPNDYYYWDDLWSVAGMRAAAAMASRWGAQEDAEEFQREAEALLRCVERSLAIVAGRLGSSAMPASPYRRLDAAAIGSLVGSYPLQVWRADDLKVRATVEFLMDRCLMQGAFFQEISHSGLNPYLTLHLAQVLLRLGDSRACEFIEAVARMASPTGQWPEAVHPRTRGGCMGDGQHTWASAEWVLMMRNCFVREEEGGLILCSGIAPHWYADRTPLSFGPTPTPFGSMSVFVEPGRTSLRVRWQGTWRHDQPPQIAVRLPGCPSVIPHPDHTSVEVPYG